MAPNSLSEWSRIIEESRLQTPEDRFRQKLCTFFTECDQQGYSFEQRCRIVEAYAHNERTSLDLSNGERNVR